MSAKLDVVLGLQWGDEGKGKIVDVLTREYPVVARFQGGPNAGHSVHFEGKSFVLRGIPSGALREGTINIVGNGVVLDPIAFKAECEELISKTGAPLRERIVVSKRTHLILPTHRLLDAAGEAALGKSKIGSTLKGIGPAYSDKTSRKGLRVCDALAADFEQRYKALQQRHIAQIAGFGYECDPYAQDAEWFEAVEYLKTFRIVDCEYFVNEKLNEGVTILAEGAQGTMLDVDYGTFPFVTSSSTSCGGSCIGLGVPPQKVGKVWGVFKAYCTRVGNGPFPTELFDETGEELRKLGHEFGAVTGRPRRCGWLDLVQLRYSVMINGVTDLIMMKSDVLSGFDTVRLCTSYEVDGVPTEVYPADSGAQVVPVYTDFPGWKSDITGCKTRASLPQELKNYIEYVENFIGVPVKIISVGPDRDETIFE